MGKTLNNAGKTAILLETEGITSKGYGIVAKYAMIDPDLEITSKGIYAYFCSESGKGKTEWPSRDSICTALGIAKNTYYKYFQPLVEQGYISVKQANNGGNGHGFIKNIYTLISNPKKFKNLHEEQPSNATFSRIIMGGLNKCGYGMIPRLVMLDGRLSIKAKAFYAYLSSFAGKEDSAYPSKKDLLYHLNISENAYKQLLRELVNLGYLTIIQRKNQGRYGVNDYILNDNPKIKSEDTSAPIKPRKKNTPNSTVVPNLRHANEGEVPTVVPNLRHANEESVPTVVPNLRHANEETVPTVVPNLRHAKRTLKLHRSTEFATHKFATHKFATHKFATHEFETHIINSSISNSIVSNSSINPVVPQDITPIVASSQPEDLPMMDQMDAKDEILEAVGYDALVADMVRGIRPDQRHWLKVCGKVIERIMLTTTETMTVGSMRLPTKKVQERMRELDQMHLEYVLDSLDSTRTEIRNPYAYVLTALYNAPDTIDAHYENRVRADGAKQQPIQFPDSSAGLGEFEREAIARMLRENREQG